jgi:hypothetical protein
MTDPILNAAKSRAEEIRNRLNRFKLVFVQCGAAFDILREPMLEALGGVVLNATDVVGSFSSIDPLLGPIILEGLELFALTGKAGTTTLGTLRMMVNQLCEDDAQVCLFSRSPKIAFAPVAGSNLLADASTHYLPLLEKSECPEETHVKTGFVLPSVGLGKETDARQLLRSAVEELGVNVLSELDFAIFEAKHGPDFVNELDPLITEAMLGAGLAQNTEEGVSFVSPVPFWKFQDAVADAMPEIVSPQEDLGAVSGGLWQIERTIRKLLRSAAIESFEDKWRKNLFNETIAKLVLDRARDDVNVTAASVAELRDPIEWLSLGELLEVVQSKKFNGLFWDNRTWRHFTQDVVPIRNRLSHMRLLKKGDKATVRMWVKRIKTATKRR